MFNKISRTLNTLKAELFKKKKPTTYYKSQKINSSNMDRNIFIHTGNSLVWRRFHFLFVNRQIKFNILFKKPLVRPTKKKKK